MFDVSVCYEIYINHDRYAFDDKWEWGHHTSWVRDNVIYDGGNVYIVGYKYLLEYYMGLEEDD